MFGNVKLYGGMSMTVTAVGPPDVEVVAVVGLLLLLAKREDDVDPKPPPPPNNNEEDPSAAVDDEDEEAPVVGAGAETPKENAISVRRRVSLWNGSTNYYVNRYRKKSLFGGTKINKT
jgi:hypothetical protein